MTENERLTTDNHDLKSLDQLFADWLAENNATIAVVAVAPVTKERISLINLMALNWPIEVVIVPKQEQK